MLGGSLRLPQAICRSDALAAAELRSTDNFSDRVSPGFKEAALKAHRCFQLFCLIRLLLRLKLDYSMLGCT